MRIPFPLVCEHEEGEEGDIGSLHLRGETQMGRRGKGWEMEYDGACRVEWSWGVCEADCLSVCILYRFHKLSCLSVCSFVCAVGVRVWDC